MHCFCCNRTDKITLQWMYIYKHYKQVSVSSVAYNQRMAELLPNINSQLLMNKSWYLILSGQLFVIITVMMPFCQLFYIFVILNYFYTCFGKSFEDAKEKVDVRWCGRHINTKVNPSTMKVVYNLQKRVGWILKDTSFLVLIISNLT